MSMLISLMALTLFSACHSLKQGDLLFHVVEQENRITAVTPGQIDHVGIYVGNGQVLEAIPKEGVVTTPLHAVLQREDGYYLRGHVKGVSSQLSISNARRYIGLPYDSLYLQDNEAIYCSELVQLSYVDRQGRQIFSTVPMTFRDSSGTIPSYWQQLYERNGMSVPEGAPGTNPGELSSRPQVIIKKLK